MTKKRTLLAVFMGVIMSLCLALAVACGGGDKVAITWKIDEHVTVAVDGYKEIPTEVEVGEELTFSVTPDAGYETTVKVGRSRLNPKGGVYTYKIKGETTVSITADRIVDSVEVTNKPNKNLYYAGEEFEPEGMVVTVKYATGEQEPTDLYTVNYQTEDATAFTLGDTYYTVSFGTKESDPVMLDDKVRGLITIDPAGGTVQTDYMNQLGANQKISNVKTDERGVVTFTFDEMLRDSIPLPVTGQIVRGVEDDYVFICWEEDGAAYSAVSAETEVSRTYRARWNAHLVNLTKIEYQESEGLPYLVIKGSFRAAERARLVLREGNAEVMLEDLGAEVSGKRGETFELRCNMQEVATRDSGAYIGMWLDIMFVADTGEGENMITDTQEIDLNTYSKDLVNTDQTLVVGDYVYSFQKYDVTIGQTTYSYLKAVAKRHIDISLTMSASVSAEGDPVVNISGTMDQKYSGKTVVLDYYLEAIQGIKDTQSATVGADGTFAVSFDLGGVRTESKFFFHFRALDGNTEYFKDGDEGNLLSNWFDSSVFTTPYKGGDLNGNCLKVPNAAGTKAFYIGPGSWGGIVGWGVNEGYAYSKVGVELSEDGKEAFYVISGTYSESITAEALEASIREEWESGDISNNPDAGATGGWSVRNLSVDGAMTVKADEAGHTFKLLIKLPDGVGHGWILFLHYATNVNFYGNGCEVNSDPVQITGEDGKTLTYRMEKLGGYTDNSKNWLNNLIVLTVIDESMPDVKIVRDTHVSLKVDNYDNPTRVYYAINLTLKNVDLANLYFGNLVSKELYVASSNHDGEIWFDVTDYQGKQLWPHLYYKVGDEYMEFAEIKDGDPSVGGQYAIVGGRMYTLRNDNDQTYYTDVCLVTEETDETKNPPIVDPAYENSSIDVDTFVLKEDGGKPVLYIEGTAKKYYTANDIKIVLYNIQAAAENADLLANQTVTLGQDGRFTVTADLSPLTESVILYSVRVRFSVGNYRETYDVEYGAGKEDGEINAIEGETISYVLFFDHAKTNDVYRPILQVVTTASRRATYELTGVGIEKEADGVYFKLSGTYSGYTEEQAAEALRNVHFDLQQRGGDWYRNTDKELGRTVSAKEGNWELKFKVSVLAPDNYTAHFGSESTNLTIGTDKLADGTSVQDGTLTYTLTNRPGSNVDTDFWGAVGLTISESITTTEATLEKDEAAGKVYYVLKGTAENCTDEELKTRLEKGWAAFTHNNNLDGKGWDQPTAQIAQTATVTNGNWELKADVTNIDLGCYTCKTNKDHPVDLKDVSAAATKVELGGKLYLLFHFPGSAIDREYWGCVGLEVRDANAKEFKPVRVDLKVESEKLYYIVTVRAIGYTQEELQALTMGDKQSSRIYTCEKAVFTDEGTTAATYALYYDVSAVTEEMYTHLYRDNAGFDGGNGDIDASGGSDPVTFNEKTYSIQHDDDTWNVAVIKVN